MPIIAVLDTESSRHPSHEPNRIVEIGLVLWDTETDSPLAEIETLVNPNSVMEEESSKIHGLKPSDLEGAPSFREVADWLPHFLNERVICGFNVSFDIRMLNYEFGRAGSSFRIANSFCARYGIPGNNKSLQDVCEALGIEIKNAHTALGDARATLQILRHYGLGSVVEEAKGTISRWADSRDDIRPLTWSRYKAGLTTEFDLFRGNTLLSLDGLSAQSQYMGFISSIFEDRKVSDQERRDLDRLALRFGFSDQTVSDLNEEYIGILEARARENRTISQLEVDRISQMASLMGLQTALVADDPPRPKIATGALISVTSEATVFGRSWSYESLSVVIQALECRPTNQLAKKDGVSVLLCPETHVRTGKASKAVGWGIPMMSFADFLEHATTQGVDISRT